MGGTKNKGRCQRPHIKLAMMAAVSALPKALPKNIVPIGDMNVCTPKKTRKIVPTSFNPCQGSGRWTKPITRQ